MHATLRRQPPCSALRDGLFDRGVVLLWLLCRRRLLLHPVVRDRGGNERESEQAAQHGGRRDEARVLVVVVIARAEDRGGGEGDGGELVHEAGIGGGELAAGRRTDRARTRRVGAARGGHRGDRPGRDVAQEVEALWRVVGRNRVEDVNQVGQKGIRLGDARLVPVGAAFWGSVGVHRAVEGVHAPLPEGGRPVALRHVLADDVVVRAVRLVRSHARDLDADVVVHRGEESGRVLVDDGVLRRRRGRRARRALGRRERVEGGVNLGGRVGGEVLLPPVACDGRLLRAEESIEEPVRVVGRQRVLRPQEDVKGGAVGSHVVAGVVGADGDGDAELAEVVPDVGGEGDEVGAEVVVHQVDRGEGGSALFADAGGVVEQPAGLVEQGGGLVRVGGEGVALRPPRGSRGEGARGHRGGHHGLGHARRRGRPREGRAVDPQCERLAHAHVGEVVAARVEECHVLVVGEERLDGDGRRGPVELRDRGARQVEPHLHVAVPEGARHLLPALVLGDVDGRALAGAGVVLVWEEVDELLPEAPDHVRAREDPPARGRILVDDGPPLGEDGLHDGRLNARGDGEAGVVERLDRHRPHVGLGRREQLVGATERGRNLGSAHQSAVGKVAAGRERDDPRAARLL
mmetsp:Transcript_10884/g.36007  ORF Transcript_10884/g.36007 Transcript_10884/m.36007 type:complete len:632 (-) Transcript_10884:1178-3073(-)